MKSVLNVIHSTLDSRKQLQPVDVLINSIRDTAFRHKNIRKYERVEVAKSQPVLLYMRKAPEAFLYDWN